MGEPMRCNPGILPVDNYKSTCPELRPAGPLGPTTVTNTISDSSSYSKFQNTQQNTYNRQRPLDIGQNSHTMVETARTTISTDQAGNDVEAFAVLIDHRSVLVWFQG